MKHPNKPGWYWVKDTGTGESVMMWWNGVEYMDHDEVNELIQKPDKEEGDNEG